MTATERPIRVQLSRRKGWRMPPNTVKVDRTTKWGNPYRVGDVVPGIGTVYGAKDAVEFFRRYVVALDMSELRGKNLACWCPLTDKDGNRVPCHADILLRIAND